MTHRGHRGAMEPPVGGMRPWDLGFVATWTATRFWPFWSLIRSCWLVAARAACSLGKEAARVLEPVTDAGEIHDRQSLTTEMVEAIRSGSSPPLGGLH